MPDTEQINSPQSLFGDNAACTISGLSLPNLRLLQRNNVIKAVLSQKPGGAMRRGWTESDVLLAAIGGILAEGFDLGMVPISRILLSHSKFWRDVSVSTEKDFWFAEFIDGQLLVVHHSKKDHREKSKYVRVLHLSINDDPLKLSEGASIVLKSGGKDRSEYLYKSIINITDMLSAAKTFLAVEGEARDRKKPPPHLYIVGSDDPSPAPSNGEE